LLLAYELVRRHCWTFERVRIHFASFKRNEAEYVQQIKFV